MKTTGDLIQKPGFLKITPSPWLTLLFVLGKSRVNQILCTFKFKSIFPTFQRKISGPDAAKDFLFEFDVKPPMHLVHH